MKKKHIQIAVGLAAGAALYFAFKAYRQKQATKEIKEKELNTLPGSNQASAGQVPGLATPGILPA